VQCAQLSDLHPNQDGHALYVSFVVHKRRNLCTCVGAALAPIMRTQIYLSSKRMRKKLKKWCRITRKSISKSRRRRSKNLNPRPRTYKERGKSYCVSWIDKLINISTSWSRWSIKAIQNKFRPVNISVICFWTRAFTLCICFLRDRCQQTVWWRRKILETDYCLIIVQNHNKLY